MTTGASQHDEAGPSACFDTDPGMSMNKPIGGDRRDFIKLCSSAGVALACGGAAALAAPQAPAQAFPRALLVDTQGEPLRPEALPSGQAQIFFYPYRSTPCFLLDLGEALPGGAELQTETGVPYRWQGGVGPNRSVVAFSAICAHKLTHPSPMVSFIGYREQPVGFVNRAQQVERRGHVIQCCSEHSLYDPKRGAAVISGPAPQPLAAIELAFVDGAFHATGVYGGDLFARYFEQFGDRLQLEYAGDGYAEPAGEQCVVQPMEGYTRNLIRCG